MDQQDLTRHLDAAIAQLRQKTGVSVAFGGSVGGDGSLRLERFDGPTFGTLAGLSVSLGEGLGGRVVTLRRSVAVNDYFDTRQITHRYDQLIRAEGLRSVVASPVVVHQQPIAVIYGAYRTDEIVGGRLHDAIIEDSRSLEQRTAAAQARAEIRGLLAHVDSSKVRSTLLRISRTLAESPGPADEDRGASLTAREAGVLSLAGIGYTDARIPVAPEVITVA
jgi:hypothetical protein